MRALKRHNSRKKADWTNVHKDPIKQIQFLRASEWIKPSQIVDIDGMVQSADDFHARYGWAPIGEQLHAAQLMIDGVKYPVHAAFTEKGFIKWVVFPGNHNVTEQDVVTFLEGLDNLPDQPYGLLDNASNQRGVRARRAMETLFNGNYGYCSEYSPELKPIERGFSLVKRWIRDHEFGWGGTPLELIHTAFRYYSDEGEGKSAAYHLFDIYRTNYNEANAVFNYIDLVAELVFIVYFYYVSLPSLYQTKIQIEDLQWCSLWLPHISLFNNDRTYR